MTNAFNNHIIRTQQHAGLLECQATTLCVCMAAMLIPYRGHVRVAYCIVQMYGILTWGIPHTLHTYNKYMYVGNTLQIHT